MGTTGHEREMHRLRFVIHGYMTGLNRVLAHLKRGDGEKTAAYLESLIDDMAEESAEWQFDDLPSLYEINVVAERARSSIEYTKKEAIARLERMDGTEDGWEDEEEWQAICDNLDDTDLPDTVGKAANVADVAINEVKSARDRAVVRIKNMT